MNFASPTRHCWPKQSCKPAETEERAEKVMNKHKPAPKQLKPGEGEILTLLGEPRAIKVLPSENEGAYLQFETSHAPGMAIPFMLTGARTRHSTFSLVSLNSWLEPKK